MSEVIEKAEKIAEKMKEDFENSIRSEIEVYPCHTNRASSIGELCLRKLVYMRLNYKETAPVSSSLQKRFGEGILQEPAIEDRLRKMGYELIQKSQLIRIDEANITGTLDDCVALSSEAGRPTEVFPIEIKALTTFICKKITKAEDLNQFGFAKKYLDQGTIYMHGLNAPFMIFVIKDKDSGDINFHHFVYDKERAAGLIEKGKAIDKFVAKKEYPDRLINHPDECDRCWFNHICLPDKQFQGGEIMIDDELIQKIDRHQELKDSYKEYNNLNKELNLILAGKTGIAGGYELTGSWVEKGSYVVKAQKYWNKKIKRF